MTDRTDSTPTPPPAAPPSSNGDRWLLGILVLLLGLNLVWLGRSFLRGKSGGAPATSGTEVTTAVDAPDFTLPLLGGGQFHLADNKGQVTFIDFWATWCAPCREELPVVDGLWRKYKDKGVRFVGVDAEGPEAAATVATVAKRAGADMPLALGGERIADLFHVDSLPHVVVIGKDGHVKRTLLGLHEADDLARAIDEALQ